MLAATESPVFGEIGAKKEKTQTSRPTPQVLR